VARDHVPTAVLGAGVSGDVSRGVSDVEHVVLLDEQGDDIGTMPKSEVHHARTPLHLAFSCYVFDADERLLLTQRALSKSTFPGLWTNTVCGHPAQGEDVVAAARRRAHDELGLALDDVRLVLPAFRYVAAMDGIVENEMCPVLVATPGVGAGGRGAVAVNPDEVEDTRWVPWELFARTVLDGSLPVSTWCRLQVEALLALGPGPGSWGAGDAGLLPPAARVA
jgi:isopentenyl-diphosphate delta-isomerase